MVSLACLSATGLKLFLKPPGSQILLTSVMFFYKYAETNWTLGQMTLKLHNRVNVTLFSEGLCTGNRQGEDLKIWKGLSSSPFLSNQQPNSSSFAFFLDI